MDEEFIPKDDVINVVEKSFRELESREKECNIRITDYLRKNFLDRQLFFSPNHPTNEVLWELSKRILEYLSLGGDERKLKDIDVTDLSGSAMPLYPCVVKGLEIKKYFPTVYANRALWEFNSNVRGFLRKYMRICWER